MNISENKKKLANFFAKFFDIKIQNLDQLNRESLEWDSMKHMELMSILEKKFNKKISFKEISNIKCYNDIIKLLNVKKK